jgi:hypothetical protein
LNKNVRTIATEPGASVVLLLTGPEGGRTIGRPNSRLTQGGRRTKNQFADVNVPSETANFF